MAQNSQYRVNQIAKDFNVKSKVVIDALATINIEGKSQTSLEAIEFGMLVNEMTKANQIKNIDDYLSGKIKIASAEEKKPAPKAEEKKAEPAPAPKQEEKKAEPAPAPKVEEKKAEPAPAPVQEVAPVIPTPAPAPAPAPVEPIAVKPQDAPAQRPASTFYSDIDFQFLQRVAMRKSPENDNK